MCVYTWGSKFYTEEEIDRIIALDKKKDEKRYLKWCKDHADEGPPYVDDDGKVCYGARFLGNGGGVGSFDPETEEEWDERMAAWKERIRYDSIDEYYDSKADCYITFCYKAGEGPNPTITVGNTKQFPHYYLLRNKAKSGDALKGIGDK